MHPYYTTSCQGVLAAAKSRAVRLYSKITVTDTPANRVSPTLARRRPPGKWLRETDGLHLAGVDQRTLKPWPTPCQGR